MRGRILHILKLVCNILLVAALVWSFVPVFTIGIFGVGVVVPVCILSGLLLVLNCWGKIRNPKSRTWRWVLRGGMLCFLAGVLAFVTLSVLMLSAAGKSPPEDPGAATVVVMGCKINGRTPSLMLSRRLQAAEEYLKRNPEAVCIVSGGQGEDEVTSEAEVMKEVLIRNGIEEERIYVEDASLNTQENIRFSREVIEENGLDTTLLVATDEFHQFRSQSLANQAGLEPYALTSSTPYYLIVNYWVREMFAIVKDLVLAL